MNRVTAIVPMRHSSERVPGKNYRDLGGIPLYHHVVRALLAAPSVGEVIIDTDSERIFDDAASAFPEVKLVERPAHLRDGHTAMNDVLEHSIEHAAEDTILQTHSTNPFVRPGTFESAIQTYFGDGDVDSVFGATRIQGRLWTHKLEAVNHDPAILARTQDLDPIYLENSCFYVFAKETLLATGNRLGRRPAIVEVDPIEATDIDIEADFKLAEVIEAAGLFGER
jgi:CMP-N-acetylneuraminic acid synthetase